MHRWGMLAFLALGVGGILLAGRGGLPVAATDIVAVKERHEAWLLRLPGVVGVGVGACDAQPCIVVYVTERTPELARQIPPQLGGFPVAITVSGPIAILPEGPTPGLPASGRGGGTVPTAHASWWLVLGGLSGLGVLGYLTMRARRRQAHRQG